MSGEWMRTGKEAVMPCLRAGLIANTSGRGTKGVH
jgi:hypothetical protein